jgi:protein O-GlcNAc transferase
MTPSERIAPDAGDYETAVRRAGEAHGAGRLEDAVFWYRRALAFRPGLADLHNNLAVAMLTLGRNEDAVASYSDALSIRPRYARAHVGLATLYSGMRRNRSAIRHYNAALDIDPGMANVRFNMGTAYQTLGLPDPAAAAYLGALDGVPDKERAWSQYLLCLNMSGAFSAEHVFAEHRRYGARFPDPSGRYDNDPTPTRRLRIGYLSVEFRRHLGGYFLKPLFRRHDRSTCEIVSYCGLPPGGYDDDTRWFRENSDGWVDISGMSDDALEARIRADRIDVLVDLAGHSGLNRLSALARKPAPVQLTWLGYANTTGLRSFDARLVSDVSDPAPSADRLATEPLVRLPGGFLCFEPLAEAPPVTPPPSWASGRVTFGSFNFLAKISDEAAALWAEILRRVPASRLLLKDRGLDCEEDQAEISARFARLGVDPGRVTCVGYTKDLRDHLALYGEVDIALDPFPYNGTITSIDALCMGVPLITRRGDRHAARVGAMLLNAVGLDELAADDGQGYVETAVRLAGDLPRMAYLRAGMRDRLRASPLCDMEGFCRRLEGVYRDLWRAWCVRAAGEKAA